MRAKLHVTETSWLNYWNIKLNCGFIFQHVQIGYKTISSKISATWLSEMSISKILSYHI